jgi:hypothetical protein
MRVSASAVVVAVGLAGCRPTPPPAASTPDSAAAPDTVRGTLVLEGAEPMAQAVLRVSGGSVALVDAPRDLMPLTGADMMLTGHRLDDGRFRVAAFIVRAVSGLLAFDGVLTRLQPDGRYGLMLTDSSVHTLRDVPETFRSMIGQRIWVAESPDGRLASYGVVTRAAVPK